MDQINALFEFGGFIAVSFSIAAILRHRQVAGFSLATTLFFTVWGFWNLAYYPHLDQEYSTLAAALLTLTNLFYLGLAVRFKFWSVARA